jgi:hypothetical protein
MKRVDVFAAKRRRRPTETREFTDSGQPGEELTLTLTTGGNDLAYKALDYKQELVEKYITGTPVLPAVEFPYVGGEPVVVSETLFQVVANLYVLQSPADEKDKYSLEELVALSVAWEDAWPQIGQFAREMEQRAGEAEGNASGAASSTN